MRKALVVILSFLMLIGLFPDTYDYVFFKLNQAIISKTLCIQKESKTNTCQGKCYLKKIMSENDAHDTPIAPTEKENNNVNLFCLEIDLPSIPMPLFLSKKRSLYSWDSLIDRLSIDKLLRPPDYSNT